MLDAKSLRTTSRSILSKISHSMEHLAKPFNLSCNIVDLKQIFNIFNLNKLISAKAIIIGTIKGVFGWWVEMSWDGFDPHRPVFGWWVVWVGLVPEEEYTP